MSMAVMGRYRGKWSFSQMAFGLMALVLFLFPLLRLALLSVTADDGSWSLESYRELSSDPRAMTAIINTLYISILSAILSSLLGTWMAFLVGYTNIRYKKVIEMLIFPPFVIPAYVMTISWTGLTVPGGGLTLLLAKLGLGPIDLYTPGGIIVMLGICHMSVVYVTVIHRLQRISLEVDWAARACGSPLWKSLWHIDLPMVSSAISSGTVLAFLADIDNFAVPAFLGISSNIPVLSTYIYEKVISFGPHSFTYGAVLSLLLAVIALAGAWIAACLGKSGDAESGRAEREPRIILPASWRRLAEWSTVAFLFAISVIPFCYMAVSALLKTFTFSMRPEDMTWDNYRFVFTNDGVREAAMNSLFMASMGTLLCLLLGTGIAYGVVRKKNSMAIFLEQMAGMTYSVPGIVLALALIFYWSQPLPGVNTGLYGSYTILILGYVTRYMVVQIKNSASAMQSMSEAAEDAALVSGSSVFHMWLKIIIPQLALPALSGSFFIFLSAVTELTMSSVMASANTKTIGLTIFNLQQAGDYSLAAAVSAVILAFMMIGCLLRLLGKR